MPKLLVVVVTYNAMHWIERCIGSVKGSDMEAQLMVIDNGSSDGTVEYLKNCKDMLVVFNSGNPGFGAANNIGLRHALQNAYDFVYLLNQDAWVEKDTFSLLIDNWNDGYAVISPVQYTADGRVEKKFAGYSKMKEGSSSPSRSSCEVVELRMVMAAHWMVSTAALRAVGGFSPAFHQYGEDDNWVDRARYRGFRIGYLPCAGAVHDRGDRVVSKEKAMRLKCTGALVRLLNPCRPFFFRMLALPVELVGMSLKNCSTVPLKYLKDTWDRITALAEIRHASIKSGAFLNIE